MTTAPNAIVHGVRVGPASLETTRDTKSRRLLGPAGVCVGLLLICVWPALYNRQPFFYADTASYIRGADAGFAKLAHRSTVWSGQDASQQQARPETNGAGFLRHKSINSVADKTVLAGRSIYYGGLLYLGDLTGRLWPVVLLQAAVVLLAIALTLKTLSAFTWLRFFCISLVLATLTPMGFFASYLMPDVFAAITILAVANLLLLAPETSHWVLATWFALLTAALLFHDSHVLIALTMLVGAILWAMVRRRSIPWIGATGIAAALVVAFAGEALFGCGVTKLVGAPPLRPPFLMARTIADGPGYRYLLANCPQSGFTVCQFLDRLPRDTSEDFLWNTDPEKGVFAVADPVTRRKLAAEQFRFVRATLAFDPMGVLAAALRDVWLQLRQFDFDEFNYNADQRNFLSTHIPEPYLVRMKNTRVWREAIPARALSLTTEIAVVLSIIYLAMALVRAKISGRDRRSMLLVVAVIAGVITNAAVCGAMSRPLDRYQARVIWLLPLAALLLQPLSPAYADPQTRV